ncbi:MAG TPA: response regulator transcription factor [Hyphomonadaceae bacterium]|nr:response regulator transcription factor [Hyphomonadaceae bacterium]HPI48185.1 response regulator transcription factor [Hyphomonadaceae bacterium]
MSAKRTILLIDDDAILRAALAQRFALHEEFKVEQAATAAEGITKAQSPRIDLILLDVDLPDMDGRDACRIMRRKEVSVPIIILTGKAAEGDAIIGLDAGANDYVAKPVKFELLLARVRTHRRIHEQSDYASFQIGPYQLWPATKLLVGPSDRRVRLTDKEAEILLYLYRAQGETVRRDELVAEVWGEGVAVKPHTLETHMYRLRQKIEPDPVSARFLITESGGYSLQLKH